MHLVTASLFLPTFIATLSQHSQVLLLRGFFGLSLTWWVARGRPPLDIEAFITSDIPFISPPTTSTVPSWSLLGTSSALPRQSWFTIIHKSMIHPESHLPKLIRALHHLARIYGTRPAGLSDFSDTPLPGANLLDGTVFLRIAALTVERMYKDGSTPGEWDRIGFFRALDAPMRPRM